MTLASKQLVLVLLVDQAYMIQAGCGRTFMIRFLVHCQLHKCPKDKCISPLTIFYFEPPYKDYLQCTCTTLARTLKHLLKAMNELIPGLPEEIALECLTRLHYSTHRVAAGVCTRWRHLFKSRDFYHHRKQTGHVHRAACFIQALPDKYGRKAVGFPKYGVSIFYPLNGTWEWLEPVPGYPDGLPLFCQVTSLEGKPVLMGGWDPVNYEPVTDVFVYEFTSRRWRRGKDMPGNRSFFALGELEGRVIIAGGHDENKNALNTAWAYQVGKDEWRELDRMSQERDLCEGVVIGMELWVVSGYRTVGHGRFEDSADVLEMGEMGWSWRRAEGAWKEMQCPRSCIGVDKGGNIFKRNDVGVLLELELGNRMFASGSVSSAHQGFFLVTPHDHYHKLNVPSGFSGFVQSGCSVEI